jgi:hypothetical protein
MILTKSIRQHARTRFTQVSWAICIVLFTLISTAAVRLSLSRRLTPATRYSEDAKMTSGDEWHILLWKAHLVPDPPMNYLIELIEDSVEVSTFGEVPLQRTSSDGKPTE